MEWLKNLSRAIDYIEENLDKTVSIDEAARIACCSAYYFQRMFSYVAGISLSEYIRRRRMTQAALKLQSTDKKILDIALDYGYTSPTSFNRAFQSVHGIPPIAAKKKGSTVNAYPPIRFSIQVTGGNAMRYRIEEKKAMRLAGVRVPLTEDMEQNRVLVPLFWEKVLQSQGLTAIHNLSNPSQQGILGVTACQQPDGIFYYIAAVTDKPVPDGMFAFEIPAADWVIFENDGPFKESIQSIFKRFLTEWLPFSGFTYAELPDIEVYPFQEHSRTGYAEVWIAVKKE